jgi:hypothetical protein
MMNPRYDRLERGDFGRQGGQNDVPFFRVEARVERHPTPGRPGRPFESRTGKYGKCDFPHNLLNTERIVNFAIRIAQAISTVVRWSHRNH